MGSVVSMALAAVMVMVATTTAPAPIALHVAVVVVLALRLHGHLDLNLVILVLVLEVGLDLTALAARLLGVEDKAHGAILIATIALSGVATKEADVLEDGDAVGEVLVLAAVAVVAPVRVPNELVIVVDLTVNDDLYLDELVQVEAVSEFGRLEVLGVEVQEIEHGLDDILTGCMVYGEVDLLDLVDAGAKKTSGELEQGEGHREGRLLDRSKGLVEVDAHFHGNSKDFLGVGAHDLLGDLLERGLRVAAAKVETDSLENEAL